ncbi:MAG: hypothetical protein LBF05_00925 [Tannerella sp.]|jgi:hypothetical protein|nr:hypothetical protein [Tannerella sp.]
MILSKYPVLYLLIIFFASLLHGVKTHAQQQTLVHVNIDEVDIMIGEQTDLHLSVTADKDKQLIIPLPGNMLMEGVEVLYITPPDTTDIKNNRMTIKYDLRITSFDSSLYLLPPFYAIDGRDTLYSDQVALKVSSPDVDLEHPEEFKDIKDIWRPPFVLADYYTLIYGILFTLFLICVVGYFIQRMRKRPKLSAVVEDAPKLPPHEQAMKELKEIRERKLWQQGRNKEYYTEVSDTLRRYISSRYGTSVMEKTSSEILDVLRNEEPGNKEVYDLLKQILQLSDFVKFAKLHPLPDENELSMFNANLFVDRTKRVEIPTAPPAENDDTGVNRKQNDEPTNN